MYTIDLHCDTIDKLATPWHRGNILKNPYHVDLTRLERADTLVQGFSTFFFSGHFPKAVREERSYERAKNHIGVFQECVYQAGGRLFPIESFQDIEYCKKEHKVGGLLTMEDAVPLGSDLRRVEEFYNYGIRLITLTWNYENALGYPNSKNGDVMKKGLKPFGIQVVEEMNRLGMLVDVSHLSDGGFWDVLAHSRKPVIASHSNARAVTAHSRNLTDEMIRAIADQGGVIGLNLCPKFLSEHGISSISNMLRHIHHIYQVGGEDVLALGTDLDGITGKLQLSAPDELKDLAGSLRRHKMPERILEKMWYQNALRVMKEVL